MKQTAMQMHPADRAPKQSSGHSTLRQIAHSQGQVVSKKMRTSAADMVSQVRLTSLLVFSSLSDPAL